MRVIRYSFRYSDRKTAFPALVRMAFVLVRMAFVNVFFDEFSPEASDLLYVLIPLEHQIPDLSLRPLSPA
jgi:hypothetical protein